MKAFFNHLPKCGGISFLSWFKENTSFKYINSEKVSSPDELNLILKEYRASDNVMIGGHIHFPKTGISSKERNDFYTQIVRSSDYNFAILRNPIERFNSYLHYTKTVGTVDKIDRSDGLIIHNESPDVKSSLNKNVFFSIFRENACASLEGALSQVLYPDVVAAFPFNDRLRAFINDYPSLLGTSDKNEFDLPLQLRSNSNAVNYLKLHIKLLEGKNFDLSEVCGVFVNYSLFAIEDVDHLISSLHKRGIVRSASHPFPCKNTTLKSKEFNINSVDKRVLVECCMQYPESFTLWKLAMKRSFE